MLMCFVDRYTCRPAACLDSWLTVEKCMYKWFGCARNSLHTLPADCALYGRFRSQSDTILEVVRQMIGMCTCTAVWCWHQVDSQLYHWDQKCSPWSLEWLGILQSTHEIKSVIHNTMLIEFNRIHSHRWLIVNASIDTVAYHRKKHHKYPNHCNWHVLKLCDARKYCIDL